MNDKIATRLVGTKDTSVETPNTLWVDDKIFLIGIDFPSGKLCSGPGTFAVDTLSQRLTLAFPRKAQGILNKQDFPSKGSWRQAPRTGADGKEIMSIHAEQTVPSIDLFAERPIIHAHFDRCLALRPVLPHFPHPEFKMRVTCRLSGARLLTTHHVGRIILQS